jgi:hypothetical protein
LLVAGRPRRRLGAAQRPQELVALDGEPAQAGQQRAVVRQRLAEAHAQELVELLAPALERRPHLGDVAAIDVRVGRERRREVAAFHRAQLRVAVGGHVVVEAAAELGQRDGLKVAAGRA